jgi:glycine/D-amino acid oxidase-like deaminating enzyme/nitrite reductase/ring-hydroxylating ferredoxin subunit
MNNQTRSLWMDVSLPPLEKLAEGQHRTQVCIIGAGIAGVSMALALAEAGQTVLVIDKDGIGAGETGRTSAHLASALDDRFHLLERWHGKDGARAAAESHAAAIERIEGWCANHAIDCDFQWIPGYLVPDQPSRAKELRRELEAATRAGLDVAHFDEGIAGLDGPLLRFERQARFHPLKYLAGIAAAAVAAGVRFVRAEAMDIVDGEPATVVCEGGARILAADVVVAANVPFHRRVTYHTKQAAYRTFVLAGRIDKGAMPDALIWDTGDPYHYVRLQPTADHDWLIVGGADHKTGQEPEDADPFGDLAAWARRVCPSFQEATYAWSGQVLEPVDGVGFIGADPGTTHVYVSTGDSGNGLTHGTVAALLLPALLRGEEHAWAKLYSPSRKRLNGSWLEENANVAAQYRDWLSAGDVDSAESLAPGEGAVIRHGVHRFAVYRDGDHGLHAFSARCPHLGCAVRWNTIESSWDCPCHGSRFAPDDGRVLNGPADKPLERLEVGDDEMREAAAEPHA